MPRTKPSSSFSRKDTRTHRGPDQVLAGHAESSEVAAPTRAKPVTEDEIRLLAYLKWEADGKPIGHDLCFWTEAERELCAAR
jgi:hypothetical protein